MDELQRSKLLRYLGERNFDYNETERQQVEYVYRWLIKATGSDDWQVLTLKLRQVESGLSGKRQRLRRTYTYLKLLSLIESGRYDVDTLRPPLKRDSYDKGWKL